MTAVPSVPSPGSRPVLQGPEVLRVVDRMAHELLEKTGGGQDVVLMGIPTRGTVLARRLAARIEAFEGRPLRPPMVPPA